MRVPTRNLTDDPVVHRIMEQLKVQNKSEKSLLQYLGLSTSMFSLWKYENGKSYLKYLDEIAEFLNVSKYFLLEGKDEYVKINTLTATEIKQLKMFRQMGNEQQKCYMKMGKFLVESSEYEKEFEKNEENEA